MQKPDVTKLAAEVAKLYLDEGVDPTRALVKIARREKLNEHWIDRVAQATNVSLFFHLQEKLGTSKVQYTVADPTVVKAQMGMAEKPEDKIEIRENTDIVKQVGEKVASAQIKKILTHSNMEKVASVTEQSLTREQWESYRQVIKTAKAEIKAVKRQLAKSMMNDMSKLRSMIKRASLNQDPSAVMARFRASAIETFDKQAEVIDAIIDEMVGMEKDAAFDKYASYRVSMPRPMDKDSEYYKLFESIIKTAQAIKKIEELEPGVDAIPNKVETVGEALTNMMKAAGIGDVIFHGTKSLAKKLGFFNAPFAFHELFTGLKDAFSFGNVFKRVTNPARKIMEG